MLCQILRKFQIYISLVEQQSKIPILPSQLKIEFLFFSEFLRQAKERFRQLECKRIEQQKKN